ncbi:conserved hypothetical protein [Tenacibaculum sp. 190524A02b]|uniref:Uncharacterized protein n=1 Tax=Tenacibaculum vairaonense TaxID=3137860 RepID=A0ABM9PNF1_9FLAO
MEETENIQKEFIEDVNYNAEKIIEAFNDRLDGALDYSVKSLEVIDNDLLSLFHENLHDVDEAMKEDAIAQFGSYIFEVARRNYGGKYYWYEQLDQPILVTGQPDFEISILAFEKVKQRIENGYEDNIPFFFKGYIQKVATAKTGDKELIC